MDAAVVQAGKEAKRRVASRNKRRSELVADLLSDPRGAIAVTRAIRNGELGPSTKTLVVNAAIERYLNEESEFVASVERGLEDAKAGRVTPHEEVFKDLDAKIDARLNGLDR